jgi:hypothetical protein
MFSSPEALGIAAGTVFLVFLLGWICRLTSNQTARCQFRPTIHLLHALFGIYGRRPRLALEVQVGTTQYSLATTALLLYGQYVDSCAYFLSVLVNGGRDHDKLWSTDSSNCGY